jgi:predicted RNase H-like HicB family nuclease
MTAVPRAGGRKSPVARPAAGEREEHSLDNSFLRSRLASHPIAGSDWRLISSADSERVEASVATRRDRRDNWSMRTFTLEYWQDEAWYVGRLREVPGVMSQGQSLAELEDNIRDAYQMMTDTEPAPTAAPILTREIEV